MRAPGRRPHRNRGSVNSSSEPTAARVAQIAAAVRRHAPTLAPREPPYFEAAVALVLRPAPGGDVELLFIRRATREGDPWSGQIALPGGRYDTADESLETTAVRETQEETSIDIRGSGELLGAIDELRPLSPHLPRVIVRPYVATVGRDAAVVPSDEVAGYFWAPLGHILDPGSARDTEIIVRDFPVRWPAIHFDEHVIWGMTERILRSFGEVIR